LSQSERFDELLWIISQRSKPLGIWGDLAAKLREDQAVLDSLRETDISLVFDLIGYAPPRELFMTPDELDAYVTLFLSELADRYPDQFLATLGQRIGSMPSALSLIDGSENVNRRVGEAICTLAASRRCLSHVERALLKERCSTIGCCNPFCPITFDPAWRTSDVMLLAQGIYDANAFDRLPILADAMQDAGCDNDDILTHCRDASLTHVRGCWVLDLVLGKE
jgi:hypothetical protein